MSTKQPVKGNKVPVSKKQNDPWADLEANSELYTNTLTVDPTLKQELDDQGYEYRFCNQHELKRNNGHRSRWVPYQRTSKDDTATFLGNDVDGYVRRGDLILCYRPTWVGDKFRAAIEEENKQKRMAAKKTASEINAFGRKHGIDVAANAD